MNISEYQLHATQECGFLQRHTELGAPIDSVLGCVAESDRFPDTDCPFRADVQNMCRVVLANGAEIISAARSEHEQIREALFAAIECDEEVAIWFENYPLGAVALLAQDTFDC